MKEELIKRLRTLEVVVRSPVRLRGGKLADFYIDLKKAYGDPDTLDLICSNLWQRMDKNSNCVAGYAHGGIPIASVLAVRYKLRLVMVRDRPKMYGIRKEIDGYMPTSKDSVAVVDDVFTTEGSLKKMRQLIEPTKAQITGYYVVVKRNDNGVEPDIQLSWVMQANEI